MPSQLIQHSNLKFRSDTPSKSAWVSATKHGESIYLKLIGEVRFLQKRISAKYLILRIKWLGKLYEIFSNFTEWHRRYHLYLARGRSPGFLMVSLSHPWRSIHKGAALGQVPWRQSILLYVQASVERSPAPFFERHEPTNWSLPNTLTYRFPMAFPSSLPLCLSLFTVWFTHFGESTQAGARRQLNKIFLPYATCPLLSQAKCFEGFKRAVIQILARYPLIMWPVWPESSRQLHLITNHIIEFCKRGVQTPQEAFIYPQGYSVLRVTSLRPHLLLLVTSFCWGYQQSYGSIKLSGSSG